MTKFIFFEISVRQYSQKGQKMADMENLDYRVTYPDPDFAYENVDSKSDKYLPIKKDEVPVVILFGWAGAEHKHLKAYSKIYEEMGLVTLRYTAPFKILFWQLEKIDGIAERFAQLVIDLKLEKRPTIIHTFSNGGSFQYEHYLKVLRRTMKPTHIKGVVFDSTPGARAIPGLANVMKAATGGPLILGYVIAYFLGGLYVIKATHGYIFNKKVYDMDPLNQLKDEENLCPQHFIYSTADKMIPYKDVEFFMKHRKSLGVEVSSVSYENSTHVTHYPLNKLSYSRSVIKFVTKCLRK